jgi:serine/threonine protein phosphatase PrpC
MNYRINKRRKNYSKKQNSSKEILLPSLNQKFSTNNQQKQIINKPINNFQNFNKLNNSLKKTDKKFDKPSIFLKNHKPYSGNPSTNKINNNIVYLKIPIKSNIPNSYERDILTANPSLIGNKSSFNNYNANSVNLRYKDNDTIKEESIKENIVQKNPNYQDKGRKIFKKMGFGVSKSSPRISSIKIISNPFENQKQKEVNDFSSKVKVLLSYGDINNLNKNNNNIIKIKRVSKINAETKNLKENNNSLNKEKNSQFNLPNLMGPNLIPTSEAKNILIKAVGKLNSELNKKHPNLKSANLNNQISENYIKNKFGPKLLKNNISKKSLNNSLKESKNNNSSIKLSEDIKQLKLKSKCFISYAYIDYPNLEHRQEMEDFHCIKQALGKRPNLSYFAIFDGHGGKDVASFLSINLHHFLIDEINNINFGTNDEENISNIIESIKSAFMKIDQNILANENFTNDVGSTATLIFIYYNNLNENILNNNNDNGNKNVERTLICANIGDSNGYLITKSNISQITKPHKCEDTSEVQRIKGTGGIVFQGRIFGKLILTRTLGDKEMKKYGVIPVPDFYTKKIEKDDLFVIIASDGIWDVINEEELYKMGNEKELSSEIFSKKIMDLAKERDTRDNSSCIVIKLNKNI